MLVHASSGSSVLSRCWYLGSFPLVSDAIAGSPHLQPDQVNEIFRKLQTSFDSSEKQVIKIKIFILKGVS